MKRSKVINNAWDSRSLLIYLIFHNIMVIMMTAGMVYYFQTAWATIALLFLAFPENEVYYD